MPKTTIADVRAAGYTVAFASGSVAVEEEALAAARTVAGEEAIEAEVRSVAESVAQASSGLPITDEARTALVMRATAQALEQITKVRDDTVAFHERALAIAKEMPDTYFVSALGDPETPDDDVRIYVSCKADGTGWDSGAQEILEALVGSVE